MPQSATADVNSAVTLFRASLRSAIRTENWQDVINSVNCLNGCFPDDLKLLFGFDTIPERRFVKCHFPRVNPAKGESRTCDTLIEYVESNFQTDRRARLFSFRLGGQNAAQYMLCPTCKHRLYLDTDLALVSQSPDIYDPKTILPSHPPLKPEVCKELMMEWASLIAGVIEDRCRRWRMSFSTNSETTEVGDDNDSGGNPAGVS